MKSADERLETLERTVKTYRILAVCMFMLILVGQRYRIVSWIDGVESWFVAAASAKSTK